MTNDYNMLNNIEYVLTAAKQSLNYGNITHDFKKAQSTFYIKWTERFKSTDIVTRVNLFYGIIRYWQESDLPYDENTMKAIIRLYPSELDSDGGESFAKFVDTLNLDSLQVNPIINISAIDDLIKFIRAEKAKLLIDTEYQQKQFDMHYKQESLELQRQNIAIQSKTKDSVTDTEKPMQDLRKQEHQTYSPFESAVISLYPKFSEDYNMLIENNFMHKIDGGLLKWDKSKQSLAEYFNYIKQKGKRHSWRAVETLFQTSKLSNLLSTNGNTFKTTSKDFKHLLEIKN